MTTCPFCGGDPFHRTDLGEPVAVVCCDLGDLYFRGKRPAPDEVTLSWGDFHDIATEITRLRSERDSAFERAAKVAEAELHDAAHEEAADDARGYSANVWGHRGRMKAAESIASSIRSLKGT